MYCTISIFSLTKKKRQNETKTVSQFTTLQIAFNQIHDNHNIIRDNLNRIKNFFHWIDTNDMLIPLIW